MPVLKTSVSCDDSMLVVDELTLPRELAQLVPSRATRLAPEEWRPFCVRARNMGLI
jgi:hypothetical protein